MNNLNSPDSAFLTAFRGRFVGVLRWEQLDDLWTALLTRVSSGWYVYHVGEPPPTTSLDTEQLRGVVEGLNTLLRDEHEYDYCGIVYADSLTEPSFIKIFDPNQLGSSCGFSGTTVLPGWILSILPPDDIPAALPPPNNRRRWWRRLFSD
ncbi:conserved hypothetical protein [Gammaproteobacteria bacterium]